MPKVFTPEQANRTLPLVRSIVEDILTSAEELRRSQEAPDSPVEEEQRELIQQDILNMMEELEKLGASFRDWDFNVGLVDFPAIIDGEDVVLCWRSDEPSVTHYHTPEQGFSGRRPIPAELMKSGDAERN